MKSTKKEYSYDVQSQLRYRGYYYDSETGLYYLQSRYYDPAVGRFISADDEDVLDVQDDLYDKKLYAYCDNNPVIRADYAGEVWITIGIAAVGGAIGTIIGAASFAMSQYMSNGSINWKSVGVAAGSGFISGAIAASPIGLGGQIGWGAAIGGASYMADAAINKRTIKVDEAIVATAAGGVSGWVGGAGANRYGTLSKTVKVSAKTTAKYSGKSSVKYAAKRIATTKSWRNNRLSISAWSSSARFSAGTGISNTLTNTWTKVKSWFSGLFR